MPYTALAATLISTSPTFHYLANNPVLVATMVGGSGGGGATPNPKTSGVKKGI